MPEPTFHRNDLNNTESQAEQGERREALRSVVDQCIGIGKAIQEGLRTQEKQGLENKVLIAANDIALSVNTAIIADSLRSLNEQDLDRAKKDLVSFQVVLAQAIQNPENGGYFRPVKDALSSIGPEAKQVIVRLSENGLPIFLSQEDRFPLHPAFLMAASHGQLGTEILNEAKNTTNANAQDLAMYGLSMSDFDMDQIDPDSSKGRYRSIGFAGGAAIAEMYRDQKRAYINLAFEPKAMRSSADLNGAREGMDQGVFNDFMNRFIEVGEMTLQKPEIPEPPEPKPTGKNIFKTALERQLTEEQRKALYADPEKVEQMDDLEEEILRGLKEMESRGAFHDDYVDELRMEYRALTGADIEALLFYY